MSEGHSVVRWARWLSPFLGERLISIQAPAKWSELVRNILAEASKNSRGGLSLQRIETHGKHLLLHLSDGYTIHCHGMMYGSWQVGKRGMSLRKPEARVRLRLQTAHRDAVFFNGPVVEFLTAEQLKNHTRLRSLGPDILHKNFDRDEVWRRLQLRKNQQREIADAILDQCILAGIGNIFKSEGLFLSKIDPRRRVSKFQRSEIERLWDLTRAMMQAAVKGTGAIVTLPPNFRRSGAGRRARNFVYFRRGKSCFLCHEAIQRIVQGEMERTTFFCPKCQAAAE